VLRVKDLFWAVAKCKCPRDL